MKKFFLAMIVAAATMINFSSCSSSSDDDKEYEIQVADLLDNTFSCTEDDNGEEFIYAISFSNDGTTNRFATSDAEVGTFAVSGSTITLTFTDLVTGEPTGETMTLKAQSKKKLACSTLKCVLKKD
jgi:hypothetical protein